jgi:hypothetical protein
MASSLCSLILIDRRAGLISSDGCIDFERACRPLVVLGSSNSESEDKPEDDDPEDAAGRDEVDDLFDFELAELDRNRCSFSATAWASSAPMRVPSPFLTPNSLLSCANGLKSPLML